MLTNVLVGYTNQEFIADDIFPVVIVNKQADVVPAVKQSHFFRNEAGTPLGESDTAADVGYDVDTSDTYHCLRYGTRHFISDDRRINEDSPFDSDRDATMLVTNQLRLQREASFTSDFWATSKWTTDVTGGTTVDQWSDYGSSAPIENVRTYKRTVRRLIGRDPNRMVLGDLTYDRLVDHPDVLERIAVTTTGIANEDLLGALFGLDMLLVGRTIYTTDAEGTSESSVSYSAHWDDDALLYYAPSQPSLWTPSAGYTFVWNVGMGNNMEWVRKYRQEEKLGEYIEVRSYYDQKQIDADAGVFFSDIVD
jgi:hypothetical protein